MLHDVTPWNKIWNSSTFVKAMKVFALLTALVSAQDSIKCYQCDYSWIVAKVDGKEVTTPVRGDSKVGFLESRLYITNDKH